MARQHPAPWVWPRNCERTVCKATISSTRFPPLAENAAVCSASASRAPRVPPARLTTADGAGVLRGPPRCRVGIRLSGPELACYYCRAPSSFILWIWG